MSTTVLDKRAFFPRAFLLIQRVMKQLQFYKLSHAHTHTHERLYRVIQNDCRGFNNLSYTTHLRQEYMYFFI
jgi:hypothetical protein